MSHTGGQIGGTRRRRLALSVAVVACSAAVVASPPAKASKITDIYIFQGGYDGPDGVQPSSGLVADSQGRLYGTTLSGGAYGYGTVYRLNPPVAGQTQWSDEILHSFSAGSDGYFPAGNLVMDPSGNLYGTVPDGGPSDPDRGYGIVFKLSNTPGWPLTILHDFGQGTNGGNPGSGVVFGPNGLLYGTTGCFNDAIRGGCGTLFSVSPEGDAVEFAVLHEFGNTHYGATGDGFIPTAVGVINGTTIIGGCFESYYPTEWGTVFEQKITPNGNDPYKVVYYFGPPNLTGPTMPPLPGNGDFKGLGFGVTQGGGTYGHGGVYTLTPSGSNAVTENILYSFGAQADDGDAGGSLIQANASGVLDGINEAGGKYGQGTFFELDPPASAGSSWTEKVDASFTTSNLSLGGSPIYTLLKLGANIFGVVQSTGTGYGAVYEVSP